MKEQYIDIANRTIATLNQGASLSEFGVSHSRAEELTKQATTIGMFLNLIRDDLQNNQKRVKSLLDKERYRLWIIVIAGNDPEGDIAGLTRGTFSSIDIERLLNATNANIVMQLKQRPEQLGILGAVLDTKILHLPAITALAIVRDWSNPKLRTCMENEKLSIAPKKDSLPRLDNTAIAKAFHNLPIGTRSTGPNAGSNTKEAFQKLSKIASENDSLLNFAVGTAFQQAHYISDFSTEQHLGTDQTVITDMLCVLDNATPIRVEMMWRKRTGRAEIANYVLTKLYNYGKAIGLL